MLERILILTPQSWDPEILMTFNVLIWNWRLWRWPWMRSWLKLWFAPRCLLMAPISPHWSYGMMQTSLKFPHHKQHLLPPDPTPNGSGMDPLGYLTSSFVPLALRPCDRCNVRMMHWCMHIECIGSFTLHFQVGFQWDRFQNEWDCHPTVAIPIPEQPTSRFLATAHLQYQKQRNQRTRQF